MKNLVMNETRKAVIEVLRNANAPMTLAEIGAAIGVDLKTGTTNAMLTAGVIVKAGETKVAATGTSPRATYTFNCMPSENSKFVMTPERTAIAAALEGKTMTLAQVSEIVGFEVKSGSINAMVSAGVVAKVGEVKVTVPRSKTVATYRIGDTNIVEA